MNKREQKLLKKAQAALEAGKLNEADKLYQKVLRSDPENVDALYLRGTLLAQIEDYREAQRCLNQAASLHPRSPYIHNNLGGVYQKMGNYAAAIRSYQQALTFDPNLVEAHACLGSLLTKQEEFSLAEKHYQRAVRLRPNTPFLHNALGELYLADQRLEAAVEQFNRAVGLAPNESTYYLSLASALVQLGQLDNAAKQLNKARAIGDQSVVINIALADIKERQGEYQATCDLLADIIHEQGIAANLVYARALKGLGKTQEAIDLCTPLAQDGEQSELLFLLGNLHDSLGNYDQAFDYFSKANQLKDKAFDLTQHQTLIQNLKTIYSDTVQVSHLPKANEAKLQLIFIVGMPRSGTSLVEQILASHPKVFGAGERHEINQFTIDLAEDNKNKDYPNLCADIASDELSRLQQHYLQQVAEGHDEITHITDKMPLNFLHLGFIGQLFPNAKILHCTRNALDTCLSCYFSDFYGDLAFSKDLEQLGGYFRIYEELMAHWKRSLNLSIMDVNYEELVQNQEESTRTILEYCDLPWDEQCLSFYKSKRYVNTLSYDQVRQPIFSKSVGRYKNYQGHLQALESALKGE